MQFDFEWDPVKAKSNLKKHKVSFERAAEIFLDPFMLSIFDSSHSGSEERWVSIGKDRNNVTFVVVHTFREKNNENANIRLISARKATKKENKDYDKR